MAAKNNLERINRLKVYLEKCTRDSQNELKPLEKRKFFLREIRKTEKTIESLSLT